MTTSPVRSPLSVARILGPSDLEEVTRFLEAGVERNVFALSWLDNYGMCAPGHPELFHFAGVRRQGELVAVSLVITERLALVDSEDHAALRELARWYRSRKVRFEHVVSCAQAVTPFWRSYAEVYPHIGARLDRDQSLYVMSRQRWLDGMEQRRQAFAPTGLRLARQAEIDAVFFASAKMHTEETLENPLEKDAHHFRRHVVHRVESERTFVWMNEHRQLLFKADVSAQSRHGAQVSGVFTPSNRRGRGIATRAMVDLCEVLFDRGFPRVTLYVNKENVAAQRVYEKVGFRFHCDYQTVFVARD